MRQLHLDDYRMAKAIVCWAIDQGVADGNPWIIRLAIACGEDLGYCIRVWRQTDLNNYSESFVNLTTDFSRHDLWKVWAVNLKSRNFKRDDSYNKMDLLLDNL